MHVESTAGRGRLAPRPLAASRWPLGAFAFGLIVHYAPSHPQPLGWVSRGTLLAALCWLLATGAFALYVTELADYSSVFGSFTTVFLLFTYVYLSAAAFLVGVEIDVRARTRAEAGPERTTGPARCRARRELHCCGLDLSRSGPASRDVGMSTNCDWILTMYAP